jgi:GT2 family glycosyltransferase
MADGWFRPTDLWALDVLAAEGFAYDSSLCPLGRVWHDEPHRRFLHRHRTTDGNSIWEVPLSSVRVGGVDVPIAGGNWFRQFPHWAMMRAFRRWEATREEPFVMYFQVWELDPEQPRVQAAGPLTRLRHYRNLGKQAWNLRDYFASARFGSVADCLGLDTSPPDPAAVSGGEHPRSSPRPHTPVSIDRGEPITLVVPCYNEELVLPYLARTLDDLERRFAGKRELRYVFVDDGSTDRTRETLADLFGSRRSCRIVHHVENRGVARAILTGLETADTEVVASIDCDCTYDPRQLENLLPCLDGADLVTASPYHPEGEVRNVPGWRLFLSRGLSRIYRRVLHCKLSTYTSCFRIYRRSALLDLPIVEEGFLGVAETLGRLDLRGGRVVECPAVLEVRMLGRSKMKILRTVLGHLRLLARLAALRARGGGRERAPAKGRQAPT